MNFLHFSFLHKTDLNLARATTLRAGSLVILYFCIILWLAILDYDELAHSSAFASDLFSAVDKEGTTL